MQMWSKIHKSVFFLGSKKMMFQNVFLMIWWSGTIRFDFYVKIDAITREDISFGLRSGPGGICMLFLCLITIFIFQVRNFHFIQCHEDQRTYKPYWPGEGMFSPLRLDCTLTRVQICTPTHTKKEEKLHTWTKVQLNLFGFYSREGG